MLTALRSMVKDEQVQLGNQHWGDQFDVQSLSSALNLGILMFCDELQLGGRQCLYNIGSQREDFPFWIALWWKEPTHFRLAQVTYDSPRLLHNADVHDPRYTCFWSAAALPAVLRNQYRDCNRLAN